jgi:ABC-2 type transport system permease protein
MSFAASLRKELMEQARTKRLLILAAVLLIFGLMSPMLAKYTPEMIKMIPGGEQISLLIPEPTMMDAVGQYVKNVQQFGILLALLMTMGMVAQEKEKGTAAMMLVKPLSRGGFLLAKFTALCLTFLGSLLLAGLGAYYYTLILFEAPDLGAWMGLTGLMWVQLVVYIAITLLASTLVRSQAAAAGIGFAGLIVFALLESLPGISTYMPGQLVQWGVRLFSADPAYAWPALGISLGIIAASLVAAWAVFARQEI